MSVSEEQQPSQTDRKPTRQHPTMRRLKQYHCKLLSEEQQCKNRLSKVKRQVMDRFEQQLQLEFKVFQKQFRKYKQDLSSDLKTVQYYLENFRQKHALNPRENNLYPLFNQIDTKLSANSTFLQSKFTYQFNYPQTIKQINQQLNVVKAQIMQKQLQQIRQFLAQNQNIRKYCNKELKQIKDIHDTYGNIYSIAQKQLHTPHLQFTGNIEQVILTLQVSKNIERLTIAIKSPQGKMPLQQYKTLVSKILQYKNLLTHLSIKLMDMEFQEQKCNLIKFCVKELKVLRNFKIQNYYKENKLGMFEDFNWLPFKKETHVVGKVW